MDLGFFQYTKVNVRVHTRNSIVYHSLASTAPSTNCRGVAILYRDATHFQVESYQMHRPNMESFLLAYGGQILFVVSCYLSPYDASMIDCVVLEISQYHRGRSLLVTVNFNAKLAALEGNCQGENTPVVISTTILEDIVGVS